MKPSIIIFFGKLLYLSLDGVRAYQYYSLPIHFLAPKYICDLITFRKQSYKVREKDPGAQDSKNKHYRALRFTLSIACSGLQAMRSKHICVIIHLWTATRAVKLAPVFNAIIKSRNRNESPHGERNSAKFPMLYVNFWALPLAIKESLLTDKKASSTTTTTRKQQQSIIANEQKRDRGFELSAQYTLVVIFLII